MKQRYVKRRFKRGFRPLPKMVMVFIEPDPEVSKTIKQWLVLPFKDLEPICPEVPKFFIHSDRGPVPKED